LLPKTPKPHLNTCQFNENVNVLVLEYPKCNSKKTTS